MIPNFRHHILGFSGPRLSRTRCSKHRGPAFFMRFHPLRGFNHPCMANYRHVINNMYLVVKRIVPTHPEFVFHLMSLAVPMLSSYRVGCTPLTRDGLVPSSLWPFKEEHLERLMQNMAASEAKRLLLVEPRPSTAIAPVAKAITKAKDKAKPKGKAKAALDHPSEGDPNL